MHIILTSNPLIKKKYCSLEKIVLRLPTTHPLSFPTAKNAINYPSEGSLPFCQGENWNRKRENKAGGGQPWSKPPLFPILESFPPSSPGNPWIRCMKVQQLPSSITLKTQQE